MRAKLIAAALAGAVVLAVPLSGAEAAPKPSWTCISGVCIGTSRKAVEIRFSPTDPNDLYFSVSVPGGRLWPSLFKQVDWIALDDATRLDFVSQVQTCDPIFRLPDGVAGGTEVPAGKAWRGYRFVAPGSEFSPLAAVWQKKVRVTGKSFRVRLHVQKNRVKCVGLS